MPHLQFPVYLHLGPWRVHPHFLFETLAYIVGFRVYLWQRRRSGDPVGESTRWSVIAAAAVGAVVGSKLLFLLEDPIETSHRWNSLTYVVGGKTIVGGLIGGLIAVEWVKRHIGESRSTGDLFVLPLIVAMCIGRIGCFLTGLADRTYGSATTLPWGIDFGDGLRRHPTQLYEILFLGLLGVVLSLTRTEFKENGDLFKLFMVGYLGWRLAVGFIQPDLPILGLTAIQWACLGTLLYYSDHLRARARFAWRAKASGG